MKKLLFLLLVAGSLASCDVNVIEPVYDGRDRVLGQYRMKEYSETYNDLTYYTIDIAKSSYSSREILFYNFYALEGSVFAYLDGNKITIPKQVLNDYEISGVGTLWDNNIDLSYSVYDLQGEFQTDYCTSTARLN